MPPKKEAKEKVVKGDEADELILNYLKSVNRPYASTDVSANLKNKVPKAAAQKVLTALAERGDITVKPYGKQTIFVYNQDKLPVMSPEEMATLDAELKVAQDAVKEQREQLRELEKNLAAAESIPKTAELPATIKAIEEENQLTLRALAPYRKDGQDQVQPLSPEEIKQIDLDFAKWRKQWVDRRKVYLNLTGQFSDCGIMITPEWREDQGITDDDDEAHELEKGEFCRPQPVVRPPKNSKTLKPSLLTPPSSTSTLVGKSAASKRSLSISDAASSQDAKPKKKAKKAVAAAA